LAKNYVVSQVRFEIKQIDRLFESYADLLQRCSQETSPGLVDATAMASVLHSFYNGVENIFLAIAKGIDRYVPSGDRWHQELLTLMTEGTPNRRQVISAEMEQRLADYLGFRHFYRHSYSFLLEWSKMVDLVIPLSDVWSQLKGELQAFIDRLEREDGA
jgi:hypothetical protein